MKCIDEVPASGLKGLRVLVRADFNVPLTAAGEVADIFRVRQAWKTIDYIAKNGGKVIVTSHMGDPEDTLEPVGKAINGFARIVFVPDITGVHAREAVGAMQNGEVLLLENLRKDEREKKNDPEFARELASLADIYVNDAFAAAHRAHASIVGVAALLPSYSGLLMRDEVREINIARTPHSPSFAILGGAKFETKAPLIKLLLEKYDHVFLTGALANDVFKARGLATGTSLISKVLPEEDVFAHPRLLVPVDVTVEGPDKHAHVKKAEEVGADEKIVDIGPDTIKLIAPYIADAKFILWNGPTGIYEEGYTFWTSAIVDLISKSSAQKVLGGGDTIAVVEKSGIDQKNLGFLSTGGGAMLEFLLKGTLPAIDALE
jgi:phosphoglycerate kinase